MDTQEQDFGKSPKLMESTKKGNKYVITFGWESDEGYKIAKSNPIPAIDEDEATFKLIDQFESYEGMSIEIIKVEISN